MRVKKNKQTNKQGYIMIPNKGSKYYNHIIRITD